MKQKPQVRVLIALVPASFVFSDYDEYAAASYRFALRILGQYIPSIMNSQPHPFIHALHILSFL